MSGDLPLTLVMVSYNKKDTIPLSIASAAQGTRRPDLIVVSDDGSNDGTQDTALFHARKWGIPIEIVRHQRVGRYRIQTMRNTCAANALDGVILLSDSDCVFGPHALEAHLAIHSRHRWAIGTGPRYEFLEGTSGPFTSTFGTLEYAHSGESHYCVPVGANYSFTKDLWRILGGFDRAFEGSYGMEEFQFSHRAARFGALCVSDPLAYVFHCPHETIFGNRDASRNIRVFDETYGVSHVEEEGRHLEGVVGSYWSGKRRVSLLGDVERLDEWGAPEGFVPPPLLQMSRTLRPLIEPALRCSERRTEAAVEELGRFTQNLDWRRLPRDSRAHELLGRLHWIAHHGFPLDETLSLLDEWISEARAADAELGVKGGAAVQP